MLLCNQGDHMMLSGTSKRIYRAQILQARCTPRTKERPEPSKPVLLGLGCPLCQDSDGASQANIGLAWSKGAGCSINSKESSGRGACSADSEHKAVENLLCPQWLSVQVQDIFPITAHVPLLPPCPSFATLKGQFPGENGGKALLLLSKPYSNTDSNISGPDSPSPVLCTLRTACSR